MLSKIKYHKQRALTLDALNYDYNQINFSDGYLMASTDLKSLGLERKKKVNETLKLLHTQKARTKNKTINYDQVIKGYVARLSDEKVVARKYGKTIFGRNI